jgi:hypothetical protein
LVSGELGVALGELLAPLPLLDPAAEPEAEPDAVPEPDAGGVLALELEDGEDEGELEVEELFFDASSPQAARVKAAAAAISRALVIPVSFQGSGAAILGPET